MRRAFTLVELMVSVAILSLIMIFLYKSYAELNISNKIYEKEVTKIEKIELLKKTIYLDFSLLKPSSVNIINESKTEDVFYAQTSHSIHDRINPYIAYIVKEKKLYRLESLKQFKEYPLGVESEFEGDYLGDVEIFRVYKSQDQKSNEYLVNIEFQMKNEILLKIKALNSK
ncbi:prepilin-type N-terminal cleavage/methylation domain-containing protein [Sulfurimonas aquatica]|uniref:Prepilin-type N-terminal cleavage/methylation domain-containing protein n=1 Tax=Sulfurimonas aquatica TaxID=2672570 RepID=A0A975AY63_9BACT|nr:prepilin-type N-terminal cleavage/methylation domain-containing protein [Sulfurimonas aquatica]QSZ40709.1 prepilin-type N-terminal cleavage/methylation domain-containing protein [Sulfurimonas aquatica]